MPDEGGPGDEMAKMDPKINQYGSFDFEEQLPKPANPFEKTASQHVRDHRYLIEVDCSLGQFKSAKLKDKEYIINAPSFYTTLQKKTEIDVTNSSGLYS